MKFTADLHIHSKYSRATAKSLDFENLYRAAQIKGITLVGTGDFTYPAWISEIETKLEPAEPGLFQLKKEIAQTIDPTIPETCRGPVRFILQTEISNIYKKDGRVRKNHNLIYFPDLASVKKFNARLDAIGNIKSDGRPILGMDAADLLALMLEINDQGFFVPAHIWTPWFSLFGSKSGFDSMEECFGDLATYIFAVETGLSSDPPMNWRVPDLDKVRLISNSDAHSPGYLGRNATVFNTDLGFSSIRNALETGDPKAFQGTLDMYPHHGKYHYDGHRKCNICLNPASTADLGGICPECGKKLTLGVLHRVQELAARPEGFVPEDRHGYQSIIPLTDILAEIFQVGPKTKKVTANYDKAVARLGPELDILVDRSIEEIRSASIPLLAEAVEKMRSGDVRIDPGYDGEFGKVNLFTQEEKKILQGERYPLFSLPAPKKKRKSKKTPQTPLEPVLKKGKKKVSLKQTSRTDLLDGLNPGQQQAVYSKARAVVIQAGPGTGKTRTLTARIAHLVSRQNVVPSSILALTFTNKAAKELAGRIDQYLPADKNKTGVTAATFHSFCLDLLKRYAGFNSMIADDEMRLSLIRQAMGGKPKAGMVKAVDMCISHCKQRLLGPEDDLTSLGKDIPDEFETVYRAYQHFCRLHGVADFEELIVLTVNLLNTDTDVFEEIRNQFEYVFIDEYQDLNYGQYELARLLGRDGYLFVIGDPDQSIYGFRGSDNRFFKSFSHDFPGCEKITLTRNYRSTQTILDASFQMISQTDETDEKVRIFTEDPTRRKLIIKETATDLAEAVAVGKMIESFVGGTSFFSMDAGKTDPDWDREYSFSDFAVLYRTRKEARTFIQAFEQEGIPYQAANKKSWMETDGIRELIQICRILSGKFSLPDYQSVFSFLVNKPSKNMAMQIEKTGIRAIENQTDVLKMLANEVEEPVVSDIANQLLNLAGQVDFKDVPDTMQQIMEETGIARLAGEDQQLEQQIKDLLVLAGSYPDMGEFLDAMVLNRDADTVLPGIEKVSLMTMHAAKGLEFPVVFVCGCEQGLIPYARDGEQVENLEEERRLFYVAMTRAMDILCLTYSKKRRIYGINKQRQPSPFIEDIEKELTQMEKMPAMMPTVKKETQLELF